MTDWSKLKVVDLKAALKKRGLPQTGLKPALVARLDEADAQDGSESEATIQDDDKQDVSSAASPDTISTALPPSGLSAELVLDEPPAKAPSESPAQIESTSRDDIQESNELEPISQIEPTQTQSPGVIPPSQPSKQPEKRASPLPSFAPQESTEDRLKRKRRSQSPPTESEDTPRKRFKDDTEGGDVERLITTQKEANWVDNHNATEEELINAEAKEVETEGRILSVPTIVDAPNEVVMGDALPVPNQDSGQKEVNDLEEINPTATSTTNPQPLNDISKPRDSRFTNLFANPPLPSQPLEIPSDLMEYETDRNISPARHPATSALYIRDLLRPLNSAQLRSHLATLATPPGQDTDPDVIVDLFLDSIKSHAFVLLSNISAASRIRNALHDRIWPEEKTRKPLWVDFVPYDKAVEWMAEETASSFGSRALAKKWEVNYVEDEDHRVTATLQEISSFPRQIHPLRQPTGPVQVQPPTAPIGFAPPTGPRGYVNKPQTPAITVARLDELFDSTVTKPVLYYKPVSKELVRSRLANIEAALSKDAAASHRISGEIHRFTFEDGDVLVDRGPEIFSGIRPPANYRGGRGGGRGGGFRPRGGYGGYGGERGGPDSRYASYRSDRRSPRDDRLY